MLKGFREVSGLRVPPPQVRTRLERSAEASAESVQRGKLQPAPLQTPVSPERSFEGGQPLGAGERAAFESRLSADFSHVRVHAGSEAAEAADGLGARAFTYGSDIVFGAGQFAPRTEAGSALLAHELTHTLQQPASGQPALLMQPKEQKGGIGSAPPEEPYTKADQAAPEDGFALFALDSATVSGPEGKKLLTVLKTHKGPVTVAVHGYASTEGTSEYNENLGAHRAAAVKKFLEASLPAKSKVVLFSHGETNAFGPAEKNRRVGISIQDGVAEDVPVVHTEEKWSLDPTTLGKGRKPGATFGVGGLTLDPNLFPTTKPLAPYAPPVPQLVPPLGPVPTFGDIDWESIHNSFTLRGQRLEDRDASAIETQWFSSYNFFRNFMSHDLAKKGANLAVPFAVESWISGAYPNSMDQAQIDFKRAYPDEKHLVLPISSDLLNAIRLKIIGKEKDDYFFRF